MPHSVLNTRTTKPNQFFFALTLSIVKQKPFQDSSQLKAKAKQPKTKDKSSMVEPEPEVPR